MKYKWPVVTPPIADQKKYETGMHGDSRIDEYYWMGDFFREGPDSDKVVEYLNEENKYTQAMMRLYYKFQIAVMVVKILSDSDLFIMIQDP